MKKNLRKLVTASLLLLTFLLTITGCAVNPPPVTIPTTTATASEEPTTAATTSEQPTTAATTSEEPTTTTQNGSSGGSLPIFRDPDGEIISIHRYVDLSKCTFGEWEETSSPEMRLRDIFNSEKQPVAREFKLINLTDQTEARTYLFIEQSASGPEGKSIYHYFYGSGVRESTHIRYPDEKTPGEKSETQYYDTYGWLKGKEELVGNGLSVTYEGIVPGSPGEEVAFSSVYFESKTAKDKTTSITITYNYDAKGKFLGGEKQDSDYEKAEKITEAPASDEWRDHYLATYDRYHGK